MILYFTSLKQLKRVDSFNTVGYLFYSDYILVRVLVLFFHVVLVCV